MSIDKSGTLEHLQVGAQEEAVREFTILEDGSALDVSSGYTFEFRIVDPQDKHTAVASYGLATGIVLSTDGTDGKIDVTIDAEALWDANTNANKLEYQYALYMTYSSLSTRLRYGRLTITEGVA